MMVSQEKQKPKQINGIRLLPIFLFKNQSILLKQLEEAFLKRRIRIMLPQELKRYIFDFLKFEFIYNHFFQKIHSLPCIKLEYQELRPILPYILAFPSLTKLCIEKIDSFKSIFTMFKKYDKKNFILLKKGNDFALSLLCSLYK